MLLETFGMKFFPKNLANISRYQFPSEHDFILKISSSINIQYRENFKTHLVLKHM